MKPLRVLIADDNAFVREGLTAVINSQKDMSVCWQATNGEEALILYRLHLPCMTIMDVRMPVMDGIKAIEYICMEFPAALVIAFTASADEERERVLNAGAKACLHKDTSAPDLLAAIRNTHDAFALATP